MVITFVTDNFNTLSNGTVISAVRFKEELEKQGHTVRVVAIDVSGEGMFCVKERNIPIVSRVSRKQNLTFAQPDEEIFKRAFDGADVVHFFMPWKFSRAGFKLAKEMGIPATAAFHVPPEHITYGIGLKNAPILSKLLYRWYRNNFYKHFDNIHCPSQLVADTLRKNRYYSKLHIISNGVDGAFSFDENTKRESDVFRILSVGRFAPEKRHDLIIKAIAKSKHREKIVLTLAGKGPLEQKNKMLAQKLGVRVEFGFFNKAELAEVINSSHLYVHASEVEAEGISCIEAFSCGRVPVICNSKKTATAQFALNKDCLFKKGKANDLAKRIDFFIENEDYRLRLEREYAEYGKLYSLEHSAIKAEELFLQAIKDHKTKTIHEKTEQGKWMKNHIKTKNIFLRFFSSLIYYGFVFPVLFLYNKIAHGLKIKQRKNLKRIKRSGAVTICNHVHTMDVSMNAIAVAPKKLLFTSHRRNYDIPVAGRLVKGFGAVPVPITPLEQSVFFYELAKKLQRGEYVHFYPEGELENYSEGIREFKRGAFYLAVMAGAPIVPLVINYRERKPKPNGKPRKPRLTITIGEPLFPDKLLMKRDADKKLLAESEAVMKSMYNSFTND